MALMGRIEMWRRLPFWKRGLVYLGCLVVGFLLVGVASYINPSLGSTAGGVFDIVVALAVLVGFYLWSVRHVRWPAVKPGASLLKVAGAEAARVVFPVAVTALAAEALLNLLTWFPIDVSGLTPVWGTLFVLVFPVWFPVVMIFNREQRAARAEDANRRWYSQSKVPWSRIFVGVPRGILVLGAFVVVYAWLDFMLIFASGNLSGQPEIVAGQYYFNSHGSEIATSLPGYLAGLRYQMRIFTSIPMIFFGVAALTTFGRRESPSPITIRDDSTTGGAHCSAP